MKVILLSLLLGIVSSGNPLAWRDEITPNFESVDIAAAFGNWKATFSKTYNATEDEFRLSIFERNWRLINAHNTLHKRGFESWSMAMNQFSDLTNQEFIDYAGCLTPHEPRQQEQLPLDPILPANLFPAAPSALDWTNKSGKSYVTPVKDQGQCGSCWTFSTTGSLESFAAIATGTTGKAIIELSEQQLVDCTYRYANGCNGGLQEDAFDYIAKEGGLCTEAEYRYTAKDGQCKDSSCGKKYDSVSGYKAVAKTESALVNAIVLGPVAVSVDAAGVAWQFYKGGVYSGKCGDSLDHAVLAVGYGTDSGTDYWKIKNSWTSSWGEEGYIRLCRNCNKKDGQCGVLLDNTYPVLS